MSVLVFVLSVAVLVGIDQWSKVLAIAHLKDQPNIPIIKDVFELHYVENPGAAFGMLKGQQWFFVLITVVIISVIVYYYFKVLRDKKYNWLKFAFILITSGAIGNFIDRTTRVDHTVVDYFYFKLIDFPVFNVADCYVVVGTILFGILVLTKYRKEFLD